MKKINVKSLCFVDGQIGAKPKVTEAGVVIDKLGSSRFTDYIKQALRGQLGTETRSTHGKYTVREFNAEELRDFQYEVDKAWSIDDSELMDRLRLKVFNGDF